MFVELPAVGDKVTKDEAMGVVESVKAVSDVYAPVSGEVLEVNDDLPDSPEMINEDPYGDGWMVKIELSDPTELDDLMSADEYESLRRRAGGVRRSKGSSVEAIAADSKPDSLLPPIS